jgi:hypothetical protein
MGKNVKSLLPSSGVSGEFSKEGGGGSNIISWLCVEIDYKSIDL